MLAIVSLAITSCARTPSDRVGPSPEATTKPSTTSDPPPPPPADLELADVHCQYGGAAPAFFVWVEATARERNTGLRATRYEVADKTGVFVSSTSGMFPIAVRVRAGAMGNGDVKNLTTPLEAGAHVHLEVFGPLSFDAFGPKVDYPTEDRAFRVSLVADQGAWTIAGKCVVGASG